MRENRIRELWRSYFIDRQVNEVLHGLFNGGEPPDELVALVTRRAPQRRLPSEDVQSSLLRVRELRLAAAGDSTPNSGGPTSGLALEPPTAVCKPRRTEAQLRLVNEGQRPGPRGPRPKVRSAYRSSLSQGAFYPVESTPITTAPIGRRP
ncbi:hypothetical protein GCM10023168_21560 [Fodinibacter luteus]|uniref:Uncharacterized protein n=1 Tax=Fodinibacter luteus TaxID=552064 RepID=A0ABP8KHE0_9MICO